MSTDLDMYPERDDVTILSGSGPTMAHYDSVPVGELYFIPLQTGTFSVYRKTNLYDDELIQKVKNKTEAVQFLSKMK